MKPSMHRNRSFHIFLLSLMAVSAISVFVIVRYVRSLNRQPDTSPQGIISAMGMTPDAIVPLYNDKNGINVDAILNGHKERCVLDTGDYAVEWPANLKLASDKVPPSHSTDPGNVFTFHSLDSIQIGSVTLKNIQSFAYEYSNPPLPRHSLISETPILGNSAFANTILAIDFKNNHLYIYSDPAKIQKFNYPINSIVLPFEPVNRTSTAYGLLSIPITIEDYSGSAILDTGNDMPIWVSRQFFRTHLRQRSLTPITVTGDYGDARAWTTKDLHFSLQSTRNTASMYGDATAQVGGLSDIDGVDGNIGRSSLQSVVTIINYPKQEIYLYCPNPSQRSVSIASVLRSLL